MSLRVSNLAFGFTVSDAIEWKAVYDGTAEPMAEMGQHDEWQPNATLPLDTRNLPIETRTQNADAMPSTADSVDDWAVDAVT